MAALGMMGFGSFFGALIGGISQIDQNRRLKQQSEAELKRQTDLFEAQQRARQEQFNLQKSEAQKQGQFALQRLNQAVGINTQQFNLGLAQQANQNRVAAYNQGQNIGQAQSILAASGVRGDEASNLSLEFNQNVYNRNMELQQQSNSLALQNQLTQYTNTFEDIGRELSSWDVGGYKFESFAMGQRQASEQFSINRDYAQNQISQIGSNPWDWMAAGLQGAIQGANFAGNIYGLQMQENGLAAQQAQANAAVGTAASQGVEMPGLTFNAQPSMGRDLTFNQPGFLRYQEATTPVGMSGSPAIGSADWGRLNNLSLDRNNWWVGQGGIYPRNEKGNLIPGPGAIYR
jgi:hypothetical protein